MDAQRRPDPQWWEGIYPDVGIGRWLVTLDTGYYAPRRPTHHKLRLRGALRLRDRLNRREAERQRRDALAGLSPLVREWVVVDRYADPRFEWERPRWAKTASR